MKTRSLVVLFLVFIYLASPFFLYDINNEDYYDVVSEILGQRLAHTTAFLIGYYYFGKPSETKENKIEKEDSGNKVH